MATYLVFLVCLAFALFVLSERWRMLAAAYAGNPRGARRAHRALDNVVLELPRGYGRRYAFNPATVSVHSEGLALRGVVPFHVFMQPLFLPFAEMRLRPTDWPGVAEAFAVTMARTEAIELILSAQQLRWMRDHGAPL